MSSVLTLKPVPGETSPVSRVVEFADAPGGESRVVAHVERELPEGGIPAYLAARGTGARSFVLWADPERRTRLATLVTASAVDGVATYRVLGVQGELIGTLVREKALHGKGLRTRWTVAQVGCPEAVGFKGRIFWWYVWWLLLPIQVAIGVGSLLSGGGDAARGPRRIIWRAGREVPLEFFSDDDEIHVHAPWVDWRLAAALSALIRTFDSWMGTPWDDKRK
ncbi:hypothetical protein OG520_34705 [Streptomyces sp. NBC_00984]|uniref:hypothetical protein n=1 Tax=Streptomyces sp. NBC_00984 TaxID=2903700 RepID=UPI00386D1C25|nr:hypothetical protein OG520_34705 [Streptomyces sp. NBC_00984]